MPTKGRPIDIQWSPMISPERFQWIGEMDLYMRAAAQLAYEAHASADRKFTNENYFDHVQRVAQTVGRSREYGHDPEVIAAAYLHDVIEDSDTLLIDLERAGMTERTISIVDAMTKPSGMSYVGYIEALKHEPEAWVIKRADMADNMASLPAFQDRMWEKYRKGFTALGTHVPSEFPSPFPSPYDSADGLLGTGTRAV